MLFQIVHTHTNEDCPARSPEQLKPIAEWWQGLKKTPGVKVLAGYVSPLDHAYYISVEADDYSTVARALGTLMGIGKGRVIPVLTMDQTLPIAESGAFRKSK
jgi:hypothetical protein